MNFIEIKGLFATRLTVGRLFQGALIGALVASWASPAWALDGLVPGSRYLTARGAAMGDAYQPFADDGPESLFYNPAAFGHLRGTHFEPMNLSFYATGDYLGQIGLDSYKIISLSSYKDTLIKNPGTFPGIGLQYVGSFATRDLGFGLLIRTDTQANADNGAGTIRYRSNYQIIPAVGGGLRLASGILRLGYSLQWVNQASGDVTIPQTNTDIGFRNVIAQGSGLSSTGGASLTLPWEWLPQFDVVARNIFGTHFGGFTLLPIATNSNGQPPEEKMTFDGSFAIQPKLGDGMTIRFATVFKDFTNSYNNTVIARLAIGGEFDFRNEFFLRLGIGSGYPSAGVGFRRKGAEFNLTWYSVERGASLRAERDQRFLLQYQFRAF